MNTVRTHTITLAASAAVLLAAAGCAGNNYDTRGGQPAPVTTAPAATRQPAPAYNALTPPGNQQLYTGAGALPQQQHAAEIINDFRPVYEKLGKPRIAFYINRDLKKPAPPAVKTKPAPAGTLADKQTARDIERIAATPFLQAGATLVDQTASDAKAGDAAPAADIAIETLVTSRQITLPTISGADNTVTIPDIHMTAIRLSDSVILGQATANDIVNQMPPSALAAGLNVQDALEATALNLMADITAREK